MDKIYDVAVLGGGASGMMAAINAAKLKTKVVILECNDSLGKKILATGNGRCNLSNEEVSAKNYLGNTRFIKSILSKYSNEDACNQFKEMGLGLRVKEGRIYPASNQASSVLAVLCNQLKHLDVEIITGFKVQKLEFDELYKVTSADKRSITAKTVILAMGGKASEIKGSNGDGYYYAEKFGHQITPLFPALAPLHIDPDNLIAGVHGVRLHCHMYLSTSGGVYTHEEGELQINSDGLSGIMIFQVSHVIATELSKGHEVQANLDLVPPIEFDEIYNSLLNTKATMPQTLIHDALVGFLPAALADAIFLAPKTTIGKIDDVLLKFIAAIIKHCPVDFTGTADFKSAQVTAGGISLDDINPKTCESMLQPGLYFSGEIMDVDGICGGYNLLLAWATCAIAGRSAARKAERIGKCSK